MKPWDLRPRSCKGESWKQAPERNKQSRLEHEKQQVFSQPGRCRFYLQTMKVGLWYQISGNICSPLREISKHAAFLFTVQVQREGQSSVVHLSFESVNSMCWALLWPPHSRWGSTLSSAPPQYSHYEAVKTGFHLAAPSGYGATYQVRLPF